DRNAGFSTAEPGRMYLPVNSDSVYGYQVTNVEAQTRNTSSLLHWTRRMIGLRKANPAFGLGTFADLGGSNPSVLSFVREFGDDVVLCVNNLSRFPQAVELDLRHWEGAEPVEMTGGSHFPAIGELPYLLTLAGHGFYWLRIPQHQPPAGTGLPAAEGSIVIDGDELVSTTGGGAPQAVDAEFLGSGRKGMSE
ncbi:MAG: maltose alpha-D-glucosyltransferase / alpha-amylase, partial [Pseudonocardiales bacterium]|nr:maltose alpha-D-glucosyltransferase / alpha-amylase [Pseudonocardiales bacterium]